MDYTDLKDTFLQLVRLGVGKAATVTLPNHIDWDEVETLAERQGMLGIIYDAVQELKGCQQSRWQTTRSSSQEHLPQLTTWLRIMGKVMQGYEQRYVLYKKAVADLGAWYQANGFRMMVLKGLACGMNWPKPEHRPYGDIDIYLFGKQKEADEEMISSFKIQDPSFKIDNSHHHHTVFQWQGFTVENHYDFLNVHHHKSNVELEAILKSLAHTDNTCFRHTDSTDNTDICLPSANFNALYLLRHAMSHFASTGMNMRQLLDWAFFVEKQGKEVDWEWLQGVLKKYGMEKMFDVMNVICVEDLGFNLVESLGFSVRSSSSRAEAESQLKSVEFIKMKGRVLSDIIEPEINEKSPKHVWKRIPFKYRRWKANAWKHELCFNDSMSSAFWSGVKNHLLKPSSI